MRASDDDDLVPSLLASGESDALRSKWPPYRFSHASRRGDDSFNESLKEAEIGLLVVMDWTHEVSLQPSPFSSWDHYTRRPETVLLPPRTEMATLRNKIAALEDEQERLRERLQHLEHRLDEMSPSPLENGLVPVDPHTRWLEENQETLRNYPDEWIALHAVRGILFHTANGDEFAIMLDGLSPEERDDVLAFHSSMYV